MESSAVGHAIKHRAAPNDVFYTPSSVVKRHLEMIERLPTDKWLDPFKGEGAYYDEFPENKDWCEISNGRDFFDYVEPVDIIVSNPPYSCLDRVLEHSVSLKANIISYLIGQQNLTAKRIEYMNKEGYGLSKICLLKVFKWYGMSYIVVFEKGKENCIEYDRTVHR
jgi:hypothetical protein